MLFNFSVLCRCSCLYAEVLPIVVSAAQPGSLWALSRSCRECNADESNCEMPLQGGRDTLHKQFFSDCLPISQSMKYIADTSRHFMQFLVCHPGQTSVTCNRGGHDQGV